MSAMFAKFSSSFQSNIVSTETGFDYVPPVTNTGEQVIDHEPDPYILELQDKGGYDSEGKSVQGDITMLSRIRCHNPLPL
jgi:hypothetical protein